MSAAHQMFDEMTLQKRKPIPDVLYHYTTMEGLLGIVRTGKLWLSHIKYLNDSLEYEFLWNLLKVRVDRRIRTSAQLEKAERERLLSLLGFRADLETFVASFSADGGDRLSQWRGYCPNGIGFSIGFSGLLLEDFVNQHNSDPVPSKLTASVMPIQYLSEDDAEKFDEIIVGGWKSPVESPGLTKERMFSTLMSAFAWAYKHNSFKEENEWRLTLSSFSLPPPKPRHELSPAVERILYGPENPIPGLSFRPGKSMLIPYREINLRKLETDFIKRITIGPTPHKDLSLKAVEELLRSHGHTNFQIEHSNAPYRHW